MAPAKQKKKENKKSKSSEQSAKDLLAQADKILQEVNEGFIFRTVTPREFPTFDRHELGFAKILGVGGFCVVKEVRGIRLKRKSTALEECCHSNGVQVSKAKQSNEDDHDDDEKHLEVSTARQYMAKNYIRNGDARYAVKRLHRELSPLEQSRGIIDLAIEAKFLTVISHPNIVKMRALADGEPIRDDYFIVLDRLYGTLEDRMAEWRAKRKQSKGFMSFGSKKEELEELLVIQLTVAYDLSAAFRYMHANKLVYRDIKPDNIGFDIRGDLKVFDFGLCKSLLPKLKDKDGMYRLTGRTGSRPYIAPEVYLCKPYNASVDVYSYGILLWEMLSLKQPFEGYSTIDFSEKVIKGGYRPKVSTSWPTFTRKLITECWSEKPSSRPNFVRIASVIRGDLIGMAKDNEAILHRTADMMDRSDRSQRGLISGIRRRSSSWGAKPSVS